MFKFLQIILTLKPIAGPFSHIKDDFKEVLKDHTKIESFQVLLLGFVKENEEREREQGGRGKSPLWPLVCFFLRVA